MNSLPIHFPSPGCAVKIPPVRAQVAPTNLGGRCRVEVGFFYVIDPCIDAEMYPGGVWTKCPTLFCAAHLADKQPLCDQAVTAQSRLRRPWPTKKLNPAPGADMKEAFNIGHRFSGDHPEVLAGKTVPGVNFGRCARLA